MDYEVMTIEQLRLGSMMLEDDVQRIRAQQLAMHNVMERKINLTPIVPTASDQVIIAPSVRAMLQTKLPAALFEQIKGFLPEDK